jgi:hypothetical protein
MLHRIILWNRNNSDRRTLDVDMSKGSEYDSCSVLRAGAGDMSPYRRGNRINVSTILDLRIPCYHTSLYEVAVIVAYLSYSFQFNGY